ncbi:hypothetical protein Acr_18g0008230 [Actinidia rufa]|uniref:Uncharacterized protein n=1 Tax=Actinidia rufa TaxID=165716 RepID=A0A7J0G790_9ERIC|nr:hypothetical protein Acr_18g0008230 [Actinidia rufa]
MGVADPPQNRESALLSQTRDGNAFPTKMESYLLQRHCCVAHRSVYPRCRTQICLPLLVAITRRRRSSQSLVVVACRSLSSPSSSLVGVSHRRRLSESLVAVACRSLSSPRSFSSHRRQAHASLCVTVTCESL